MNLIENIFRINTLISEDKKTDTLKNMIHKVGLNSTLKMIGGYDELIKITGKDYVNFILDSISDSTSDSINQTNKDELIKLLDNIVIKKFDGQYYADGVDDEIILFDNDKERLALFMVSEYGCWGMNFAKTEDGTLQELGEFDKKFEELPMKWLLKIIKFLYNEV